MIFHGTPVLPTPEDLISDPAWFPCALDAEQDRIDFVRADRSMLAREAFLDERAFATLLPVRASLSELLAGSGSIAAQPPAFVFHSAFCCSTLLARALDAPGAVLALKEPNILMDLANALRVSARMRNSPEYANATCALVFKLLARPFVPGEHVVIKPTNAANNLLPCAVQQGSRILILYGPLRSFLVSVLKKGEPGRAFVRRQYNIFSLDDGGLGAIAARQAMGFTDLQVAALVWRSQMERFQVHLQNSPDGAILSLEFHALLANPERALKAVARHLGLKLEDSVLKRSAESEIFRKNAKFTDREYGATQRALEERDVEDRYAEELALIEKWAATMSLGIDIFLPLQPQLDV